MEPLSAIAWCKRSRESGLKGTFYFGKYPSVDKDIRALIAAKNNYPDTEILTDTKAIRQLLRRARTLEEDRAKIEEIQAGISTYLDVHEKELKEMQKAQQKG
jgi:hypothetical protein